MPSLVETVRMMQAEAISAAQKKKIAAIEKDKKLSDKERFRQIDAVMNEEEGKMCKECGKVHEGSCMGEDNTNDKSDDGEGMDKVQPKALKKKFDDRKDKDIDNDGDEDESDEYLHNRRKTVSKAVKEEEELDEAPRRKGAPKMTGDSIAIQRDKDRALNKALGRTKTGRKKPERTMTSTQRSLASLRKEEVELDEGAKEKALKALMTKALGGKQAKAGYTSAIANNGDFVVKDGGGRVVGRIEAGKFKDPLKEADEYTDDEVETKKAPAKKKKGKEDPKNKSGEEVDVEPTLDEAQEMTPEQEKMREKYVMKLKGRMDEFKKKYGDRAEKVMYATATKMAMKK